MASKANADYYDDAYYEGVAWRRKMLPVKIFWAAYLAAVGYQLFRAVTQMILPCMDTGDVAKLTIGLITAAWLSFAFLVGAVKDSDAHRGVFESPHGTSGNNISGDARRWITRIFIICVAVTGYVAWRDGFGRARCVVLSLIALITLRYKGCLKDSGRRSRTRNAEKRREKNVTRYTAQCVVGAEDEGGLVDTKKYKRR